MPAEANPPTTGLISPVAFFAGLLLLASAPIFRGGNRHVVLIALEAMSLLVLFAVLLKTAASTSRSSGVWHLTGRTRNGASAYFSFGIWFLLLSPLLLGLLYLTPVPINIWRGLGDRAVYVQTAELVGVSLPSFLPISLNPAATWASLLAALPLLAAFLLGQHSNEQQLRALLRAVMVISSVEVLIGFMQLALGGESVLYFDGGYTDSAIGTFANRSHYANYLVMALMMYAWLAFTTTTVERSTDRRRRRSTAPASLSPQAKLLWWTGGAVLVLGVLISRSRGAALSGLPLVFTGVLVATVLRGGTIRWRWLALGAAAILACAVFLLGTDFIVERYVAGRVADSASFRQEIVKSTMDGVVALWPWGAGWGTYESAYPRFQVESIGGYVEHAHHDYVQVLFEGGLAGALLLCVASALVVVRAAQLFRRVRQAEVVDGETLLMVLSGLALLAAMAHATVEFNMHIPANAALAAFLMGIYLRPMAAVRPRS